MLTEYLIRCGVILQFVPPGATSSAPEPLPIHPPAAIRQIDHQESLPAINEHTIEQLIELREAVGIGALRSDSAADFEATLRAEFGADEPTSFQPASPQQDTIELMRTTGERLDEIANQLERIDSYQAADDLRTLAQRLRLHGRAVSR
jgi:hypothetical protein